MTDERPSIEELGVPLGARLLGCRACLPGQHTADGKRLYCASCPITLSRKTGQLHRIATTDGWYNNVTGKKHET